MPTSNKYLAAAVLGAVNTLNAKKAMARTGPASVLSFAAGLPTSELAKQYFALTVGVGGYGVARGALKTNSGRAALALTGASAFTLWQLHKNQDDAGTVIEEALVQELGSDYRNRMAPAPMTPRPDSVQPMYPTPAFMKNYVEHGNLSYGDAGKRNLLDIWKRPDVPMDGKAPVLLQVHGGAWTVGNKEQQAFPLLAHLAERGWVCVSINYRLSPRSAWPDHIVDVKRAIGWIKENIADYGGDPDFIAITGGSAGGHLSSLAALTPNDPQFQPGFEMVDTSVQVAVPFYGQYDFTNRDASGRNDIMDFLEERVVQQSRSEHPELYDQASPMSHVGPHAVPMFLFHGVNDSLIPVEQARSMVEMLRKESQKAVVYAELPEAQHAFDVFGSTRTNAAIDAVERFLNVQRAGA